MQAMTTRTPGVPIIAHVVEILVALFVVAVLTNTRVPLIGSDRAAFYALALIGIALCGAFGIGPTTTRRGWVHPITLIGIALGLVAFALVAAVVLERTSFLDPLGMALYRDVGMVSGDRLAFIALASVMAVKVLINVGQQLVPSVHRG
jgi:hypothetical protein